LGLGFLANVVIAAKFGAGKDMDVFFAATTLPYFIAAIICGALSFTFIPVFAEYRLNSPGEIWKVVSSFINLSAIVSTILCVAGIVAAYPIMKVLAPGFDNAKLIQAAALLRLMLPVLVLSVINELMASVYYSDQRFLVPFLNKVINPLILMTYIFLFHASLNTKSIALAMLTASFVQAGTLASGFLIRKEFSYSFVLDYRHPGIIKMLKLMTPLILGMIVYRAVPITDRFFLSKLSVGSISHIGYAWKLISAIPPIIGAGITMSIFPLMAQHAASRNYDQLRGITSEAIRMLLFLSIPVVFISFLYGDAIIKVIFERGAFTSVDSASTYKAFAIYSSTIPAIVVGSVLAQGFFVFQDTVTPTVLGIAEMAIYVILCSVLVPKFHYLAIPIAFASYFNASIFWTAYFVRRKMGSHGGYSVLLSFIKNLSSAAFALLIVIIAMGMTAGSLVRVFISILMFLLIYGLISRLLFKTKESDRFQKLLGRGLKGICRNFAYQPSGP
jgi:putative peptidoglycan lipid II flippase